MTTVAKLHLFGLGTSCLRDKLMSKTNAEDRGSVSLHSRNDMLHGLTHNSRVTGSVGDKQSIVFLSGIGREIVIPRANQDFNASFQEAPELVILHTHIKAENTKRAARRVFQGRCRVRLVKLRGLN